MQSTLLYYLLIGNLRTSSTLLIQGRVPDQPCTGYSRVAPIGEQQCGREQQGLTAARRLSRQGGLSLLGSPSRGRRVIDVDTLQQYHYWQRPRRSSRYRPLPVQDFGIAWPSVWQCFMPRSPATSGSPGDNHCCLRCIRSILCDAADDHEHHTIPLTRSVAVQLLYVGCVCLPINLTWCSCRAWLYYYPNNAFVV